MTATTGCGVLIASGVVVTLLTAVHAWWLRRRESEPNIHGELMDVACVAREDAERWRRRALRLGWKPRRPRPSVVDARRWRA